MQEALTQHHLQLREMSDRYVADKDQVRQLKAELSGANCPPQLVEPPSASQSTHATVIPDHTTTQVMELAAELNELRRSIRAPGAPEIVPIQVAPAVRHSDVKKPALPIHLEGAMSRARVLERPKGEAEARTTVTVAAAQRDDGSDEEEHQDRLGN